MGKLNWLLYTRVRAGMFGQTPIASGREISGGYFDRARLVAPLMGQTEKERERESTMGRLKFAERNGISSKAAAVHVYFVASALTLSLLASL